MEFEWDERKNRINILKHGIDFADAIDVFNHPVLTAFDGREDYGEERRIALGWMKAIMAVVVYVERYGPVIRIVSARKATKHEVKRYEQSVKN
ncbi:BrnT family toxin [Trinickia sp. Y13]|uniref:BrnT family toxin n=1 Tax=Trinickia sp. Y13 TaxID=2917807 RepID=UPI002405A947|nr:BrnT family toxin [Trinickia sp. Y13]MDG0023271.1 BrnT family toxin [Trinickia sp. Y13]